MQGIYTYWKIQYNEFFKGGNCHKFHKSMAIRKIYPRNLHKKILLSLSALENCETIPHQNVGIGQFMKNFSLENNPPHGGNIAAPVQYVFITCPVKNGSQSYFNTMYAVTIVVGGCTNVSCTLRIKH